MGVGDHEEPSSAHLSTLHFFFLHFFVLLLRGWVRAPVLEASHSQPSPPSLLVLSACLSRAVSFFKNSRVKVLGSPLKAGLHFVLIWAVLFSSCHLRNRGEQKSSFVCFCTRRPHHRTTNSCCLKSYLLVTVVPGACEGKGGGWGPIG